MAAWGTALYSDDTTCDVRDDYVNLLRRGLSGAEAVKEITNRFGDLLQDVEIECLVYLSLADTAWKFGRLDPDLREHALKLIAHGADVFVWERDAPSEAAGRRRTLEKLKQRLLCAQPARREVKPIRQSPKKIRTTAEIGTVFLLPLRNELYAALVLTGYSELENCIEPGFVALDWRGADLPTEDSLHKASGNPIVFSSGLGACTQVGFFPVDGRKNPLAGVMKSAIKMKIDFPFNPLDTTFIYRENMIDQINAHFIQLPDPAS
jgi:hypothetical protein